MGYEIYRRTGIPAQQPLLIRAGGSSNYFIFQIRLKKKVKRGDSRPNLKLKFSFCFVFSGSTPLLGCLCHLSFCVLLFNPVVYSFPFSFLNSGHRFWNQTRNLLLKNRKKLHRNSAQGGQFLLWLVAVSFFTLDPPAVNESNFSRNV